MILKSKTIRGTFEHVFSEDDALDRAAEGWQKQWEGALDHSDWSLLPLREGAKPAVWKLRHLSPKEWRLVMDRATSAGMESAAFTAAILALVEVSGLYDAEGAAVTLQREIDPTLGRPALSAEQQAWLDDNFPPLLKELGNQVIANLTPRKG